MRWFAIPERGETAGAGSSIAVCHVPSMVVYRHRPTFDVALNVPGVPLDDRICDPLGAVWAGAVSTPPGGNTIEPLNNTITISHRQRATGDLTNQ
jgi:hypothetical protein